MVCKTTLCELTPTAYLPETNLKTENTVILAILRYRCEGFVYYSQSISQIMGHLSGYVTILVGLMFTLGAFGAYSEASELQDEHDTFCGGIMEALLDWDGNCEDLREYISYLEIGALVLGIIGISLIVSGNNEVKKSTEKYDLANKNSQSKKKSEKTVIKEFSVDDTIQISSNSSNGFCGNCGTSFQFNSSDRFCTKCGNPREPPE